MTAAHATTARPWGRGVLAVLLACGVFGPRARAQDPKAAPEKAIAAIQEAGGKVERDEKGPDKPVIVVNFATTQAADDVLANLKGLSALQKLTLNGTKITDAGLEQLKGLTGLQKLYLVDTKVTDAGLEHLKGMTSLQILSLVGTQVTDAGLEHLKGLTNLQMVFLYGTKVSDAGAKALQEALPKVKIDR
jgi:Leucine-rich repeat (LRR) protein